ncbi:MutT/nudix family protein [gamma proteobacterium HdN1]|nr:MutT/nudix family protein [gamma proteobacterium HdN1]
MEPRRNEEKKMDFDAGSHRSIVKEDGAPMRAAPLVTVDVGIFTLHEGFLKVLLVKRAMAPEKGKWALPGGIVDTACDASLESTAKRKLRAKTGVQAPWLEQVGTVGNAHRDPRGWSLTVMYFALLPYVALDAAAPASSLQAGEGLSPVEAVSWVVIEEALKTPLAFDHDELLVQALERIRSKVLYTMMPAFMIDSPFTLSVLQRAYEIIMGRPVEKKAFRRRLENAGVLIETGEMVSEGPGRPAMTYRIKPGVQGFNFSRQLAP